MFELDRSSFGRESTASVDTVNCRHQMEVHEVQNLTVCKFVQLLHGLPRRKSPRATIADIVVIKDYSLPEYNKLVSDAESPCHLVLIYLQKCL